MSVTPTLKKLPTTIILESRHHEWLRDKGFEKRISKSEIIRQLIDKAAQGDKHE